MNTPQIPQTSLLAQLAAAKQKVTQKRNTQQQPSNPLLSQPINPQVNVGDQEPMKTEAPGKVIDLLPAEDSLPPIAVSVATNTALIPPPALAIAPGAHNGTEGFDAVDLSMPRLCIGQKTGEIGEQFGPGSVVVGRTLVVAKLGEAVDITVLSLKKCYQENITYDQNSPPRIFDSIDQVIACGGVVNKKHDDRRSGVFVEIADALVFLWLPKFFAVVPGALTLSTGDRGIVLAWRLRSSAYYSVARRVFSDAQILFRGKHISEAIYSMVVTKQVFSAGVSYVPALTLVRMVSPSIVEAIANGTVQK